MQPDEDTAGSPDVGRGTDARRAAAWRLIAHLFRREVDAGLAARLRRSGLLEAMGQAGFPLPEGCIDSPEALQRLRVEYTRVLIGPGRHAAPYGSVYHPRDLRKGQLWGTTTQWFRRFALDHGVTFGGDAYDGIPDHMGHELDLYSQLLLARFMAHQGGDVERVGRLDHSAGLLFHGQLARWVPLFLNRVREIAEPGSFYAQLAGLTGALLEAEGACIGSVGEETSA